MTAPPVSVVIPAYNAAGTIGRALASVVSQTYDSPVEIIVVDDASSDDLKGGIKPFDVRLVTLPRNVGPALALKAGLEAASHAFVAFLDADDEWLPGKLAAQTAALAAMPDAAVVATAFTRIGRDGQPAWTYGDTPFAHGPHDFWKTLLADAAILKSSALVRRDAALATRTLDSGLRSGEDQALFLALATKGPVAYIPMPLVLYHDHPGSLTDRVPAKAVRAALAHNLAAITREAHRLTFGERRAILGRRHAEAATGYVAAGAWAPALAATARAIVNGNAPAANLWRLITNLPPVKSAKAALR